MQRDLAARYVESKTTWDKKNLSLVSDAERKIPTRGYADNATMRFTKFQASSIDPRLGISPPALETSPMFDYFSYL